MSTLITFRCPDDLAAQIQSQVEATGKDKTSILIGLLRQSLSIPEENQASYDCTTNTSYIQPVLDERITQLLDERMTQITSQLAAFEERLGKLKAR